MSVALGKVLPRTSFAQRVRTAGQASVSALPFVVLFAVWELAVRAGWVPAFVLPTPTSIAMRVLDDISSASVRVDFVITLFEVMVGFFLAALLGVVLGAMVALIPLVDRLVSPLVIALQTIPKVAVAPVLIIWFGFGIESKVVLVALIDFFPILVNAVAGFRSTDARQLLLMKALRATPLQVFFKVRLLNAVPYLMAGMQIAMVLSVIGAVLGEFLGSARGLGSQILQRQGSMDIIGVFSILVLLSVMGMTLNFAVKLLSGRLAFWSQPQEQAGL